MLKKVADKVWKVIADSNVYFLDFEKKIIIDAGRRDKRQDIRYFLEKVIDVKKIDIVILTHMHYDHVGNIDLFSNAKVYASAEEIEDFKRNPLGAVHGEKEAEMLKEIELNSLPPDIEGLQVVSTPGHTRGSICLWDNKRKIMFSGDTFFGGKIFGRTDLPTSVPQKMMESIIKLSRFEYEHLCPGHDY